MTRNLRAARLGWAALAALPMLAEGAISVAQAPDLAELTLEQLTTITVTSASRREERLIEAPASIFVITGEDIRRAGASTIAEALRLAPNLQVARIDNNQYGITARGFNATTANKMLVLIDGRTAYTPLFSGVFWDAQDVLLDDIDRIEVISGPAATLWGANGVSGVINIMTLSADRTRGTLVTVEGGDMQSGAVVRQGGTLGNGHYRVYAKYFDFQHQRLDTGATARDESKRGQAGFRADWARAGGEAVTLQGEAYRGEGNNLGGLREFSGASILGRWERRVGNDSMRLQAYYDRTDRDHTGTFGETLDLFDVEYQQTSHPRPGHELVWGAGHRHARDRVRNSAALAFIPANKSLDWSNVFAQDDIELRRGLHLAVGLKLETNPYTGHEWLPNARLSWHPSANQLVWATLSRSVRAPSRLDRELFAPGRPPFNLLAGNDTFRSEIARVVEVGYRSQLSPSTSFSVTAFHHEFPNLRSIEPSAAGPALANGIEGRTSGVEGWGSFRSSPRWRVTGGFVAMDQNLRVKPGSVDIRGFSALGNDPRHTALLRSSWDFPPDHELDVTVRHVGKLPDPAVPAYTALDARYGWRLSKSLELSLNVRNALNRGHPEFGAPAVRAEFERSVHMKIQWKTS